MLREHNSEQVQPGVRIKVTGLDGPPRPALLGQTLRGLRTAWLLAGIAIMLASVVCTAGCGTADMATATGTDPGAADRYEVLLVPETNAGWAGWCFIAIGGVQGGACDSARNHAPVIAETWSGSEEPAETVGVALTTAEVARVKVGEGVSVSTRAERSLPGGSER
jgi:hypothetical protein